MENSLYSNLGHKSSKAFHSIKKADEQESRIKHLLDGKWQQCDSTQMIKIFCEELKHLLEFDQIAQVISRLFELDHDLNQLRHEVGKSELVLPNLDNFYKHLSPILLRTILENNQAVSGSEVIKTGWLEAMRVSIEEEIYIWNESVEASLSPHS